MNTHQNTEGRRNSQANGTLEKLASRLGQSDLIIRNNLSGSKLHWFNIHGCRDISKLPDEEQVIANDALALGAKPLLIEYPAYQGVQMLALGEGETFSYCIYAVVSGINVWLKEDLPSAFHQAMCDYKRITRELLHLERHGCREATLEKDRARNMAHRRITFLGPLLPDPVGFADIQYQCRLSEDGLIEKGHPEIAARRLGNNLMEIAIPPFYIVDEISDGCHRSTTWQQLRQLKEMLYCIAECEPRIWPGSGSEAGQDSDRHLLTIMVPDIDIPQVLRHLDTCIPHLLRENGTSKLSPE